MNLAFALSTLLVLGPNHTEKILKPAHFTLQPKVDVEMVRDHTGSEIHWNVPSDWVEVSTAAKLQALGSNFRKVSKEKRLRVDDKVRYAEVRFHGGKLDGKTLTVGDRFVPLSGAGNFRDLGGYSTSDGLHTRWGLLYRSTALDKLTSDDDSKLDQLGIKTVIDLRGVGESASAQDNLPADIVHKSLPIEASHEPYKQDQNSKDFAPQALASHYCGMLDKHGSDVFGPWLKSLAESEETVPSVLHCAAGKDRTGVGSALLLLLLKVPKETVIADYSLSNNDYFALSQSFAHGPSHGYSFPQGTSPSSVKLLLMAYPNAMSQTIDYLNSKYGGAESYARAFCGLSEDDIETLRSRYLEQVAQVDHCSEP